LSRIAAATRRWPRRRMISNVRSVGSERNRPSYSQHRFARAPGGRRHSGGRWRVIARCSIGTRATPGWSRHSGTFRLGVAVSSLGVTFQDVAYPQERALAYSKTGAFVLGKLVVQWCICAWTLLHMLKVWPCRLHDFTYHRERARPRGCAARMQQGSDRRAVTVHELITRIYKLILLDQISHRPVTHMTPVITGHDGKVTGLTGMVISDDAAIRQPRHCQATVTRHTPPAALKARWRPS
jgi:hypothetical protein